MPVSHIGLTVSHLPTSCSFFLSALQPLGYRYIGQQGNQISLGVTDADFFLRQATTVAKAGAARIAFSASSRAAVREFYASALTAGGRPHCAPGVRGGECGCFSAAVLDSDGNSIEVIYRDVPDAEHPDPGIGQSGVLTWRENVVLASAAPQNVAPSAARRTPVASVARSVSAPVVSGVRCDPAGDISAKTPIGTLLGAAAGAAVAYAMCKGEGEGAKAGASAYAALQARIRKRVPKAAYEAQPVYESLARTLRRNISETGSHHSASVRCAQQAIEPPPAKSYYSPTYVTVPPSQMPKQRAVEYLPAPVAGARSHDSTHRSVASSSAIPRATTQSTAARSTFIDTSMPSEAPRALLPVFDRRSSADSTHSRYSSKSKARSFHTTASKHSSKSKSGSKASSETRVPPAPSAIARDDAAAPLKPPSIIGSVLGPGSIRQPTDSRDKAGGDDDDLDTVAPSDSISCAGSSRRDNHSRCASHGKHSRSSQQTRASGGGSDDDEVVVARPVAISEAGSTSTVRPWGRRGPR